MRHAAHHSADRARLMAQWLALRKDRPADPSS
jgi:hypothetical protein